MKLSRTACYAIRAVTYIAHQGDENPIVGHEAAKELQLSGSFLLRILVAMSRAGLLRSIKGPNGGYRLAKAANEITLLDILEAVDGPIRGQASFARDETDGNLNKRLDQICNLAADQVRKQLQKVKISELASKD